MNYNEVERKVREATNPDEAWGPHGSVMAEIAQATYRYDEFPDAMGMLWKRLLQDRKPQSWRRIYKSLLLLHHLICNGSERVVETVLLSFLMEHVNRGILFGSVRFAAVCFKLLFYTASLKSKYNTKDR